MKKTNHDARAYLFDMLESALKVSEYVDALDFNGFWESSVTRDAVALRLAMIGEAAKGVDEKTERKLRQIPWEDIRGLRNRIVHDYGAVNFRIVWKIAREDVPRLIDALKLVLEAT